MNYLLKKITLRPHFDKYSVFNSKQEPSKSIESLSKINIFVGANNSGKSRFMRLIASERQLLFVPDLALDEINNIRKELASLIKHFLVAYSGPCRPPIPNHAAHLFRSMPPTDSAGMPPTFFLTPEQNRKTV